MPRLFMYLAVAAIIATILTTLGLRPHGGEAITAEQADVNHSGAVTMSDLIRCCLSTST